MVNIIRSLFGLSPALGKEAPPARGTDPYRNWRTREVAAIRQCTSVPDLAARIDDYDGYLREAAIARAVEWGAPELLPAIAARLNDWVPQVRRAAKNGLLTLVPTMPATALLAQLPAIDRLVQAQRDDHSEWLGRFEDTLLAATGPQAIVDGIRSQEIRLARACFRIARQHRLVPSAAIIEDALHSKDIRIAIDAAAMVAGLPEEEQHALYLAALASPFGAVRTLALRGLLALASCDHAALARSCLLDPQSSVRALAAHYLKGHGDDPDAFYVERLRSPQAGADEVRICLLALAAGGKAGHAAWMERHAASPAPRIRMAALMGWVRLDPARKDDIAVLALRDPVARVRKLALTLIRDFNAYVTAADAVALAQSHRDYRLMLRLARQDPWAWIDTIACLALQPEAVAGMRDVLADELDAWGWRSAGIYVAPKAQQIALLTDPDARADLKAIFPRFERVFSIIDGVMESSGRA